MLQIRGQGHKVMSKKSEIKVFKDGKSASFSNYEDVPEKVINIYKNAEEINPDYFDKAG